MPPAKMPRRPSTAILLGIPGFVAGWIVARYVNRGLGWAFAMFNKAFDVFAHGYARVVGVALRLAAIVLIAYVGLLGLTAWGFISSPTGFIPEQDQGYVLVNVDLPDAASVQRTQAVLDELVGDRDQDAGRRIGDGRVRSIRLCLRATRRTGARSSSS